MAHRFTAALSLFILSLGALAYLGHSLKILIFEETETIHFDDDAHLLQGPSLQNLSYYKADLRGPRVKLSAHSLTVSKREDSRLSFHRPEGLLFRPHSPPSPSSSSSLPSRFHSQKARYDGALGELRMEGEVEMGHSHSKVKAREILYNLGQGHFKARGRVTALYQNPQNGDRLLTDSEFAEGSIRKGELQIGGGMKGEIIRKRSYEPGLRLESKIFRLDLDEQLITLKENVVLKRKNLTAKAQSGEIHLSNYNKKLKYFTLFDDVKVVETLHGPGGKGRKRKVPDERKAYGEKLEGHIRERKIVLSGAPRVVQGENVIYGNLITLFEDNEVIEVDDSASKIMLRKKKKDKKEKKDQP
ncbi:MAG: hypothetical protein OXB88_05050 [Bacteriovoracales bacterium]|nr:hypothetical protein [Bacteriovoracales bacterium]